MNDFVEVTGFAAAPLGLGDFDGTRYPGAALGFAPGFSLAAFWASCRIRTAPSSRLPALAVLEH
jgi:hypothetical protein